MSKEKWFIWQDKQHSAAMNMAIDEALMGHAKDLPGPLLRLYEWEGDCISFGYTQKFERVPLDKEDVVRRPTGGGIVFHKEHFTYTVVLSPEHWIVKDTLPIESYNWLNRSVQESLKELDLRSSLAAQDIPKSVDRAGMVCFTTPTKYDLLSDLGKIAGAAQRRTKMGMLHQGSIECIDYEQLNADNLREVMPHGFEQVIPCEFENFDPWQIIAQRANDLFAEKYANDKWNKMR